MSEIKREFLVGEDSNAPENNPARLEVRDVIRLMVNAARDFKHAVEVDKTVTAILLHGKPQQQERLRAMLTEVFADADRAEIAVRQREGGVEQANLYQEVARELCARRPGMLFPVALREAKYYGA